MFYPSFFAFFVLYQKTRNMSHIDISLLKKNFSAPSPTPPSPSEDLMVYTTYEELKEMRDNGELVAGQKYRFTYSFITEDPNLSGGNDFDIIVTALSENQVSENVLCASCADDDYWISSNTPETWKVRYTLDYISNDFFTFGYQNENSQGWILEMTDGHNNHAFYDFKNLKWDMTGYDIPKGKESHSDYWYTFDDNFNGYDASNNPITYLGARNNYVGMGCYNIVMLYGYIFDNKVLSSYNIVLGNMSNSCNIENSDNILLYGSYNNVISIRNSDTISYNEGLCACHIEGITSEDLSDLGIDDDGTIQYCMLDSSGNIKVWKPADLVQ